MGRKTQIEQVVSELIKRGVRASLILVIFGLFVAAGCSPAPSQAAWVRANGGLLGSAHLARVQSAQGLLKSSDTGAIRVSVINSDAVGAYAWPGGEVYVTRGLVDLLDQQELAAALAHEMGHLIADHAADPPSSLRGAAEGKDSEISADAIGVDLLAKQGIDRGVMTSMLRKVCCSGSVSPACRKAMLERIQILSH